MPFILTYGKIPSPNMKEFSEFIDETYKNKDFGFEYQSIKEMAAATRRKPNNREEAFKELLENPVAFGADFWNLMASGDVWYHSYDGIIILLIDIFFFVKSHGLNSFSTMKSIMKELKRNLQVMLYCVILIADKYSEAQLDGLIHCLHRAYASAAGQNGESLVPENEFRFGLYDIRHIKEFYLEERYLNDASFQEAVKENQEKVLMKDMVQAIKETHTKPDSIHANNPKHLENIKVFLAGCFTSHLLETNQQIYDLLSFYDTNSFYDVCLKTRMTFKEYGFHFTYAVEFFREFKMNPSRENILENEKNSEFEVDLNIISKRLTKIIQKGNPVGRKSALREEKKLKLDVNFEYAMDSKGGRHNSLQKDSDEFGVNPEAVFLEFEHMKLYAVDLLKGPNSFSYSKLIDHFLWYFEKKSSKINPFDMAIYFSIEFLNTDTECESSFLNQISFYNEVFKRVEKVEPESELWAHFETFLVRLEQTKVVDMIFEKIACSRSVHLEIEGFKFLTNVILKSESFFMRVSSHFLEFGDELSSLAKKVMSKETLKALAEVVYKESNNTLRVRLCQHLFEFIIEFFKRAKNSRFEVRSLAKCDKLAFHLYRRLGEFTFALRTFFKPDSTHLFVSSSDQRF